MTLALPLLVAYSQPNLDMMMAWDAAFPARAGHGPLTTRCIYRYPVTHRCSSVG